MEQTQTETKQKSGFEGLSGKEAAEKIAAEGGREGIAYAVMVTSVEAYRRSNNQGFRSDIMKNLYMWMKAAAIEGFLLNLCKDAMGDEAFKEGIEQNPMLAMAVMGEASNDEKNRIGKILQNIVNAACDEMMDEEKAKKAAS